jgi:hypothetical protein
LYYNENQQDEYPHLHIKLYGIGTVPLNDGDIRAAIIMLSWNNGSGGATCIQRGKWQSHEPPNKLAYPRMREQYDWVMEKFAPVTRADKGRW